MNEVLIESIERAKHSQFGLTAVKVELEAKFGRFDTRQPSCPNREDHANGEPGQLWCESCDADGVMDAGEECPDCRGTGQVNCPDCASLDMNWHDNNQVHDFLLTKLVKLGLARKLKADERSPFAYKYVPKHPLVFSKVYTDMTVDTEWTFTLSMDNPENVLLLPKILKVFYSIKDELGRGVDVSTAGMHTSLLNSEGGVYPSGTSSKNMARFMNFRKSLILLMPALYFLASPDGKSRELGYRRPMIEREHTAAINYSKGALEFRLFDTCYEQPERILDNMVVILNCMRFWTSKYTRNHLAKISNNVSFGITRGTDLARFYRTSEHIDLLNRGLRMIKPSYYSVAEVKAQRGFTLTKRDTSQFSKQVEQKVLEEYKLYDKRFGWTLVTRKHSYIANWLDAHISELAEMSEAEVLERAEAYASVQCKEYEAVRKLTPTRFREEELPRIGSIGEYKLCVN